MDLSEPAQRPQPDGTGGASVDPTASGVGPAIELLDLAHRFPDGTEALRGIDLRIERGEVFGLLGPNGAGKTTLIRHITTELTASRGEARLFGRDVRSDPLWVKRRIGVTPQSSGLFGNLAVRSHLAHFASLKGLSGPHASGEVDRVLEECRLQDLSSKRVGTLSGGQRRKLVVAHAMLGDPEVLILDEPTVGLDPVARREIWVSIESQRSLGKTILLTSHYLDEVERLAQRIAFIGGGEITHVGSLSELCGLLGWNICVRNYGTSGGGAVESEHHFSDLESAQEFARAQGFQRFSIGPVNLEAVYFGVVGSALED